MHNIRDSDAKIMMGELFKVSIVQRHKPKSDINDYSEVFPCKFHTDVINLTIKYRVFGPYVKLILFWLKDTPSKTNTKLDKEQQLCCEIANISLS